MIDDEFTNSKSNNDSFISKSEFGNLQDSEFSDGGEMHLHRSAYNPELMKKSEASPSEVTSSAASESSAGEASVASSTTASGIAASSVGAVATASVVAIGAISVATGISVALHDYHYDFERLIVSSNQLEYSLNIEDAMLELEREKNEGNYDYDYIDNQDYESQTFTLRVHNKNFDSSREVWLGYNEGVFAGLSLGEKYNITLTESRYGGETLYNETFTTFTNSTFFDFTLYDYCDLEKSEIYYEMDVIDENNIYDNYKLEFFEPEIPEEVIASFDIPEERSYKTLSLLDDSGEPLLDLNREWGYRFSFFENGEKVDYLNGSISFYDQAGRESTFFSFDFDKTYSYKENTIEVKINYVDDLGWYDNFVMTMTEWFTDQGGETTASRDIAIPLSTTSEWQVIDVAGYDIPLNTEFTYKLTADVRGVNQVLVEENTRFPLLDNSGAKSEFNELIFDKTANFITSEFPIQLDYVDDFYCFSNFVFTLYPIGVNAQYDFDLDNTTEEQYIFVDDQIHYLFSFDYEFSYELTCQYNYSPLTLINSGDETFKFTDISGGVTEFYGLEFDGTYSHADQTFNVCLDYQDDFNYYSDFVLAFYSEDDPNNIYAEVNLEKVNTVQTINMLEYDFSVNDSYYYSLSCKYRGETTLLVEKASEPFQFNDPNAVSEVNGITFVNNEINYVDRSLVVQLDYQDDYDYYDNFRLVFYGKNSASADDFSNSCEVSLLMTTQEQTIYLNETDFSSQSSEYLIDFINYDLAYNLYWDDYSIDVETKSLFADGSYQTINLSNAAKTEFNSVESDYQIYSEQDATSGTAQYVTFINLDFVDENEMWSNIQAYWESKGDNGSNIYEATIYPETDALVAGWQKVTIDATGLESGESICNGEEWELVITADVNDPYSSYSATGEEIYRVATTPTYTTDPDLRIFTVNLIEYVSSSDYSCDVYPVFSGDSSSYADVEIILITPDQTYYTYSLDSFSDYCTFNLDSPSEGTLSDINSLLGVPLTVRVSYCTLTPNVNDPDNPIKSSPITTVCLTNHILSLSV